LFVEIIACITIDIDIDHLFISTRIIYNKKLELMFMRRARAYASSCSNVFVVYIYLFRRNLLLFSQKSPKITNNSYFGVQGHSRLSMLMPQKRP